MKVQACEDCTRAANRCAQYGIITEIAPATVKVKKRHLCWLHAKATAL